MSLLTCNIRYSKTAIGLHSAPWNLDFGLSLFLRIHWQPDWHVGQFAVRGAVPSRPKLGLHRGAWYSQALAKDTIAKCPGWSEWRWFAALLGLAKPWNSSWATDGLGESDHACSICCQDTLWSRIKTEIRHGSHRGVHGAQKLAQRVR
jgi:hypothetical protein